MNINDDKNFALLSMPMTAKVREGSKGSTYTYVDNKDVLRRLNEVYGLRWNFEILRESIHGDQVVVTIRIHYPTEGGMSFKDGIAGKKVSGGNEIGNMYKAAVSLALVKAASLMGIRLADPEDEVTSEQKELIIHLYEQLGRKPLKVEKMTKLTVELANELIDNLKEALKEAAS